MLLATGEARYADNMERTLYNGFLSGLALDGGGYSYVNPLHVRDQHRDAVERGARRLPWYACACCPPNVMRLLASLQHYLATEDAGGVQIHHYAAGEVGGVRVATDYPWDGRVELEVVREGDWTLSLRVPAWAVGARLDAASEEHDAPPGDYARIERRWTPGDRVTLELPLRPRLTAPHPRIDAVRGCLAIERGPLVYCVEGADAPGGARIDDLRLDAAAPLRDVRAPTCSAASSPSRRVGRTAPPTGGIPTGPMRRRGSPRGRTAARSACWPSHTRCGATAVTGPCACGSRRNTARPRTARAAAS
jgi:DUF1680 family protein